MTENQRNYLADLAAKKGVELKIPVDIRPAEASAKIEELKLLPDAVFADLSLYPEEEKKIDAEIEKIVKRLSDWRLE